MGKVNRTSQPVPSTLRIVETVARLGPIALDSLADRLSLSAPEVERIVTTLQHRRWLRRAPGTDLVQLDQRLRGVFGAPRHTQSAPARVTELMSEVVGRLPIVIYLFAFNSRGEPFVLETAGTPSVSVGGRDQCMMAIKSALSGVATQPASAPVGVATAAPFIIAPLSGHEGRRTALCFVPQTSLDPRKVAREAFLEMRLRDPELFDPPTSKAML